MERRLTLLRQTSDRGQLLRPKPEFDSFYDQELGAVLALTYALTGSWPVAEDLAQETFVRAYRHWTDVSQMNRPDAWIRKVAVNLATSRFRRLASEARALARLAHQQPATSMDSTSEDLDTFLRALRGLPTRQAQAAALHYVDDLPISQVAAVMGCAEGTVKAHLHYARQALVKRLELVRSEGG